MCFCLQSAEGAVVVPDAETATLQWFESVAEVVAQFDSVSFAANETPVVFAAGHAEHVANAADPSSVEATLGKTTMSGAVAPVIAESVVFHFVAAAVSDFVLLVGLILCPAIQASGQLAVHYLSVVDAEHLAVCFLLVVPMEVELCVATELIPADLHSAVLLLPTGFAVLANVAEMEKKFSEYVAVDVA